MRGSGHSASTRIARSPASISRQRCHDPAAERLGHVLQGPERARREHWVAGTPQQFGRGGLRVAREFAQQRGLADAGLSADERDAPGPALAWVSSAASWSSAS